MVMVLVVRKVQNNSKVRKPVILRTSLSKTFDTLESKLTNF